MGFCVTPFSALQGGLDYLVLNHIGTNRFQEWTGDVEYTRWLLQVRTPSSPGLAEPGTALGSSKARPKSLAMVENNPFTSFLSLKSSSLEALLLQRCFAQMLYICEEECLGRTSDFSPLFCPYFPLAQEFRIDGQFQAVVFSSGRSVSEQPALPTGLWHVHTKLFEMVSAT